MRQLLLRLHQKRPVGQVSVWGVGGEEKRKGVSEAVRGEEKKGKK